MDKKLDICHPGAAYVLVRISLRLAIFCIFAAISPQGFGKALESLLMLAIIYCVVAAAFRREEPFRRYLTHFDEAAAYGVVAGIAALGS